MQAHVTAQHQKFAKTRMMIYSEGYLLRLMDILYLEFPMLAKYLGENKFEAIALKYIAEYPSAHFSVNLFSRYFSEFLANTSPYQRSSYISELAALEWELSR